MVSDIEQRSRFLDTLDWLHHVLIRHTDSLNIALVRIAYGTDNVLGETYGAPEALRQLAELTYDLKKSFRSSDLVGRDGTDFWIIFPYTPFSDNVFEKLTSVLQKSTHDNLNIVDREIAIFELPTIYAQNRLTVTDSVELLHFLRAHQTQLASHVFKIS